jgi:hypothetical protein
VTALPLVLDDGGIQEPGWSFEVRPYLWAATISGQAAVGALPPVDFEKDFDEILDDLDFAFMMSVEARAPSDRIGVVLDSLYMDLEGTTSAASWELQQRLLELDLTWRFAPQCDLLAGARYVDLDTSVSIPAVPTSDSGSESWIDPIVGARGALPLGERWWIGARGDIGGFGVGSQLSWQLEGYLFFETVEWLDLALGYRYLDIDYEGSSAEVDLAFGGPVLGLDFRF